MHSRGTRNVVRRFGKDNKFLLLLLLLLLFCTGDFMTHMCSTGKGEKTSFLPAFSLDGHCRYAPCHSSLTGLLPFDASSLFFFLLHLSTLNWLHSGSFSP